jgi:hypothetical protein
LDINAAILFAPGQQGASNLPPDVFLLPRVWNARALPADAPTENRHQYKTLTHSVRGFGCIRFMDTMSGVPPTPGFVATISKTISKPASAKPLPNARQK